jgi:hypothetical protein
MNKFQAVHDQVNASATPQRRPVYERDTSTVLSPEYQVHKLSILARLFIGLAAPPFFALLGLVLALLIFDASYSFRFPIAVGVYCVITALLSFLLGDSIAEKLTPQVGTASTELRFGMLGTAIFSLMVVFMSVGVGALLIITGDAANTPDKVTGILFCSLLSFGVSLAAVMSGSLLSIRRYLRVSAPASS